MNPVNDGRERSGWRILIVGTGGQGVLTAARLLCDCFVELGHDVVSGQLHGMAQRGGSVESSVIVDAGISPVIGTGRADVVVGLEPVETARALGSASSRTIVCMNTSPVIPYVVAQRAAMKESGPEYPDVEGLINTIKTVTPNVLSIDATRMAADAGSERALNMVMLGCVFGAGGMPCSTENFWEAVARRIPASLAETNSKAFLGGVEAGGRFQPCEAEA